MDEDQKIMLMNLYIGLGILLIINLLAYLFS